MSLPWHFYAGTGALTSMEELTREVPDARKWFQLYPWADEEGSYEMVARARDPDGKRWPSQSTTRRGGREHNERNGYSFPFKPNVTAEEMERTFGYVGARSVSEIGPHIFASRVPGTQEADRLIPLRISRA